MVLAQISVVMELPILMGDARLDVVEEKNGPATIVSASQTIKEYLLATVLHNAAETKLEKDLTANALMDIKEMVKIYVYQFQILAPLLTESSVEYAPAQTDTKEIHKVDAFKYANQAIPVTI